MEKVMASDRDTDDQLGYSIAIDGDYVIVGAINEDYDENGGNYLGNAGAAYIYKLSGTNWTQVQKITAPVRHGSEYFGFSVDISGDYAIVGTWANAYDESEANYLSSAGAVWIFYNDAGIWTFQQKLVPPDRASSDRFGNSVGISSGYAIIGAPLEDEDSTGSNTLDMAGSAYIYKRNGTTWSYDRKIVNSDRAENDQFGISVGIDGNYCIVGAHQEDEDAEGNNTQSNAGSAYIYYNNGGLWEEQQKIVPDSRPGVYYFAKNCAIDGNRVIASTYPGSSNKAYVFTRSGSTWSQEGLLQPSDGTTSDWYGYDSDISGDYAIVGAWGEDEDALGANTMEKAGSAYIYHYNSGWSQDQKIVASDRDLDDYFGYGVGISGSYIAVSALYEDIDGTHANAGAAYMFGNAAEVPLPITLTSFVSTIKNSVVTLSWETASEINNSHFLIYRNDNVIGTVKGSGTSSKPRNYSFIDDTVVPGATYTYVLGDIDYANKETRYVDHALSVTVMNKIIDTDYIVGTAYPNPFNPTTTIEYTLPVDAPVEISIYDIYGQKQYVLVDDLWEAGLHRVIWHAHDYPSGIYLVSLSANNRRTTQKIILMK